MKHINIFQSKRVMKEQKIFKIIILEDSETYNDILTKQLEHFTAMLAMERNCRFEIQSYTSPNDFLRNLKNDTDIAFVDYYLGNGITGLEILKKIKEKCWDCKVIIISQARNIKTTVLSVTEGVADFIFKDNHALSKSCFILEEIINASHSRHAMN